MVRRWNQFYLQLYKVLWITFLVYLQSHGCRSLNLDGEALLEFSSKVEIDPYGAFETWNPGESDPCSWSGIHCIDGKVVMLNLKGLSLRGMLAPELGKLSHLRALVLYKNNFSGVIPKEFGKLTMLKILDLRGNNLTGEIPKEIGDMMSLKQLLLCNNNFQGSLPSHEKLNMLSELQVDQCPGLDIDVGTSYLNRKLGHRSWLQYCVAEKKFRYASFFSLWQSSVQKLREANFFMVPFKGNFKGFLDLFKFRDGTSCDDEKEYGPTQFYVMEHEHQYANSARRRLLQEASNLPAPAASNVSPNVAAPNLGLSQEFFMVPSTGSGSFPAVPSSTGANTNSKPVEEAALPSVVPVVPSNSILPAGRAESQSRGAGRTWAYLLALPGAALLLTIAAGMLVMFRAHARTSTGPWRTGLSGQLQKAFVTGVPKLNRAELEAACEDFSNIIQTRSDCTIFKGTLSSGVEIAVVSTAVASSNDWSKSSEMLFQRKIDTLSRVNHKNFVNLLGYCEEDEPFMRMMVFEYAPNGTLFEHIHVKELEHLDWAVRTRIIMGIAYCLQYMHHELHPPVVHSNLRSHSIFLTDDYAAKIAEVGFWKEVVAKGKLSGEDDVSISDSPSTRPESNVYDFGILLLEIISGKHPYSEEQGSFVDWVSEYLNDKHSINYMIDPTLKSLKNDELDVVCEVVECCLHPDPKRRPTMREVTAKLREVIAISPESATPRLSPLWWAELEILTVEAS